MPRLSNDPDLAARATGFDSWYHSLPSHLSVDGFRGELPLIYIPDKGKPTLMLKEIDRTNVELERPDNANVVFHNPYFTFDAALKPTDAMADVVAAAESVAADGTLLDPRLPVDLHDRLASKLGARTDEAPHFVTPGYHYVVTRGNVGRCFERGFGSIVARAKARMQALGMAKALAPFLEGDRDDSFGPLDAMLEHAGIDVLLVSSPLNVQELSGFPMRLVYRDVWAALERGSDEIHVMSRRELPWLEPGQNRRESDYAAAFARGRVVGYEERDLSFEAARGFGINLDAAVPATDLLRRWRERRSWRDLPFYVVAAEVTLTGIETALELVSDCLAQGNDVTELDAYTAYRETVRATITKENIPIRVETYFTHTHAGNRSLLPARATDFVLRPLTSLKIDAGLLVYDEFGLYRAVSDITRSIVGSEEARWVSELLDRSLTSGVIEACRPGSTGDEVFRTGMSLLEPHRDHIVSTGLAPDVPDLTEAFKRDVGHLLGKQEPATVGLKLGDHGTLEAGMVGAAEFQWPFRDHCIGVEDLFFVTDDGPVNLTRAHAGLA